MGVQALRGFYKFPMTRSEVMQVQKQDVLFVDEALI